MIEPIAATVPGPEPEMAAKNMHDRIVTIPRLPGTCPNMRRKMRMMSWVSPPFSMMLPARIKAGMASSAKLSTPLKMLCAANTRSAPRNQAAAKPVRPSAA